ncbi:hypothetical protein PM082_020069 [Marasmius tenuissimus]|nr:hypothetical protein PM082_020069 [Marasmius tenuissimus]
MRPGVEDAELKKRFGKEWERWSERVRWKHLFHFNGRIAALCSVVTMRAIIKPQCRYLCLEGALNRRIGAFRVQFSGYAFPPGVTKMNPSDSGV